MFTIRYMKCGRKWRVVAHEGGVVNEGFYCNSTSGKYGPLGWGKKVPIIIMYYVYW